MLRTTALLITLATVLGMRCSGEEPDVEKFTQRDLRIALRLHDLSDVVEALDQTPEDGKDREMIELYIEILVNELDDLVGAEKLAVQVEKEIERLKTEEVEVQHPKMTGSRMTKLLPDDPKIQRMLRVVRALKIAQNNKSQQDGADQPATAPKSKPEGKEKPKPESAVRPR